MERDELKMEEFKYNLICLSGKAGSGKNTVAKHLFGIYNFTGYSYADELKKVLKSVNWNGEKDLKGRKLLQQVGVAFRNYDPYTWINKLIESNKDFRNSNICLVDCRHVNEIKDFARQLKKYNPNYKLNKQININIVGEDYIRREMDAETKNDISETSLDYFKFDYVISNDGSIADLYKKVDSIIYTEFPNLRIK